MSRLGGVTRFDKIPDLEKATPETKNSPSTLAQKMNVEHHAEILEAYSLLLFAIIGVEFDNYLGVFKKQQRLCKLDRIYSYSDLYLNFYENFKKIDRVG